MRRTVNVSFRPVPRLPMTTPANTWMRSLSPSTTLVCTFTESPTPKLAPSLRNCSDSSCFNNAWFITLLYKFLFQQIRSFFFRPHLRLLAPPFLDPGMMARDQHVRHLHSAKFRGPRVLGIFQQPVAERFIV